jgi:hypothetical protein
MTTMTSRSGTGESDMAVILLILLGCVLLIAFSIRYKINDFVHAATPKRHNTPKT